MSKKISSSDFLFTPADQLAYYQSRVYEVYCPKDNFIDILTNRVSYVILPKKKKNRQWKLLDTISIIEFNDESDCFTDRSIKAIVTHVRDFAVAFEILSIKIISTCNIL